MTADHRVRLFCARPRTSKPRRSAQRRRLLLECLDDRTVPAAITWINPAGGDWSDPCNWDLHRLPMTGDDVVIRNLGGPGPDNTITYNDGTATGVRSIISEENLDVGATTVLAVSSFGFLNGSLSNEGWFYVGDHALVALFGGAATSSGTFVLDSGSYLVADAGSIANMSTIGGSGAVQIADFTSLGDTSSVTALILTNGVITTFNTASVTLPNLDYHGGTLVGSADFTITDIGQWTVTTLNGTGAITIAPDAHISINPPGLGYVYQAVINQGYLADNAEIHGTGSLTNEAGATLEIHGNTTLSLVNEVGGTVLEDTPGASIYMAGPVRNDGTLEVLHGIMTLAGGGSGSGTFFVHAGCELAFGGFNLTSSSVVAGDGDVRFVGWGSVVSGTYDVRGTTYVGSWYVNNNAYVQFNIPSVMFPNLEVSYGWLAGTADITIPTGGSFTWRGGYVFGTGTLTIEHGATATILGGALGQPLVNHGAVAWTSGDIGYLGVPEGVFINASDGTFDVTTAVGTNHLNRIGVQFINEAGAHLTRSAGAGTVAFGLIENAGAIDVAEGTLLISGTDFFNYGSVYVGPGSRFLTQGPFDYVNAGANAVTTLDGAILGLSGNGTGTVKVLGGTLRGTGTIYGGILVSGGQLAPGLPVGTLTIVGNMTVTADGSIAIEVEGANPVTPEFDQLIVTGSVAIEGGPLEVTLINGYLPSPTDHFTLIDNQGGNAVTGTFTLASAHDFAITYVGGDGNDVVLSAPGGSNVVPHVSFTGLTAGVRAQALAFAGSFIDPDADVWSATVNFGDGTGNHVMALSADKTFAFSHAFTATGTYTITVTIHDGHGDGQAVHNITIAAVGLQADPVDPSKTALFVGGTTGNDTIEIRPAGNSGAVEVVLNNVSQGIFTPTGRIVVYAQAGDDDVQVAGSISRSAWLYGGPGDDRLKGGAGHDVLLGEEGDDMLVGGSGRDVLIGGTGSDRIVGNADDDILIAGFTLFDNDQHALCAIMDAWTSNQSYAQRTTNIRNQWLSVDGSAATVFDDGVKDTLTGSEGQDWFFANLDGDNEAAKDKITDLSANEFAADLDWIGA